MTADMIIATVEACVSVSFVQPWPSWLEVIYWKFPPAKKTGLKRNIFGDDHCCFASFDRRNTGYSSLYFCCGTSYKKDIG